MYVGIRPYMEPSISKVFCHICLSNNPVKRHVSLNLCKKCYERVVNADE